MGVDKNGNPKELGFKDLPDVHQDMEVFYTNIQQYGFDDFGIMQKTGLSMDAVKKVFNGYQRRINDNADAGLKTLTIVYYGGHGMINAKG